MPGPLRVSHIDPDRAVIPHAPTRSARLLIPTPTGTIVLEIDLKAIDVADPRTVWPSIRRLMAGAEYLLEGGEVQGEKLEWELTPRP